jgi:MYXO-CTERM domain-containing protein
VVANSTIGCSTSTPGGALPMALLLLAAALWRRRSK